MPATTPPPLASPAPATINGATPPLPGTVVPPPTPPPVPTYYDQKYQRAFDTVPENPTGIATRINLLNAVRVSLARDSRIKLGSEDSVLAQGALQVQGGAFDTVLTANASHGQQVNPRDPQNVRTQNETLQANKDAERAVAAERAALAAGQPPPPGSSITVDGQSSADILFQQQLAQLIAQQATMSGNADIANAANQLSQSALAQRDAALKQLDDQLTKEIRNTKVIETDRPIANNYDLTATKLFRNGVNSSAGLTYMQTGNRPGDPPINRSSLFLQLDVPLLRGSGTRDTGAPELAAKYDLEASLLTLRHTVSSTVLSTSLAYWGAVGAREQLKLLIRNTKISGALVELTSELIKGGSLDVAPADLAEIQTKEAQARVQQTQGELALVQAVQTLGLNMGLDEWEVQDSPLPTENFPPLISREQFENISRRALARAALERRADLAASIQLQKSHKALLDQARLQLRPQLNLRFRGEMNAVDFGINYRHYVSAFAGRYSGPGFIVSGNFEWAPANNVAKGNILQQEAGSRQAVLASYDLSRNISSAVLVDLAALDSSLRQIEAADAEANFSRQALEAARTRFKLGQTSILDTIILQERYISALADVITARQLYAQSLVQLRFDTATLIPTNSGTASLILYQDLTTLPPVGALGANEIKAPTATAK